MLITDRLSRIEPLLPLAISVAEIVPEVFSSGAEILKQNNQNHEPGKA
jgi:hypothetical protein